MGPASTLTINYRLIVEVFPTSGSVLSTFSKPSCEYDPVALEIYSRLAYRAPVGVEVKFNGLGDWFIDGINAVKDVAMSVGKEYLKGSKHPLAKVARKALGVKKNKVVVGKGKNIPKAPTIKQFEAAKKKRQELAESSGAMGG